MPTLWIIHNKGNPISLCIDQWDRLTLKYNGKVVATYREDDQNWYGFKDGKLVKVFMPSIKEIVMNYIDQS